MSPEELTIINQLRHSHTVLTWMFGAMIIALLLLAGMGMIIAVRGIRVLTALNDQHIDKILNDLVDLKKKHVEVTNYVHTMVHGMRDHMQTMVMRGDIRHEENLKRFEGFTKVLLDNKSKIEGIASVLSEILAHIHADK